MDALAASLSAFPLVLANEGERVRILSFNHGRSLDRKLAELGLAVGNEVVVMARQQRGPMVVARDDMRIALGSGMAHRILVTRVVED
jgi:ferrous iron transport protein A